MNRAEVRRDRIVILAAIALLTALAWAYVVWLANQMVPVGSAAMPMSMPDMGAMAPGFRPPGLADFFFASVMWMVMMVGMMAPSVAPAVLLYAQIGRQAAAHKKPFAGSAWFASGYFLAWTLFSLGAAITQMALISAGLLTPMLKSAGDGLAGVVLLAAGFYQWSPWKASCLAQCQTPLSFIQSHGGFKKAPSGALLLGLHHGSYCVGCCWSVMLLLLAGGVMNTGWIAVLAILVLVEKLVVKGAAFSRATGAVCIAAGVILIYRGLLAA